MASWMVHLRVADKLLDKLPNLAETEFVVGNIAPDSGVPNEDWSAYFPNKEVSHFKMARENGKKGICVEEYIRQYFTEEMRIGYSQKQYSFYLGYLVHLLTDILWKKEIFETAVEAEKEEYVLDPAKMVWKWKADWYDLDFCYLRDNPRFRAFEIYEMAKGFSNTYLDIFAEDAFDNRRKYITEFYHQENDNLDREYPYLTKEEMDTFVERAEKFVIQELQELHIW